MQRTEQLGTEQNLVSWRSCSKEEIWRKTAPIKRSCRVKKRKRCKEKNNL